MRTAQRADAWRRIQMRSRQGGYAARLIAVVRCVMVYLMNAVGAMSKDDSRSARSTDNSGRQEWR